MDKFIKYIKSRTVGFYLSLAAAVLIFIQAFIYVGNYASDVECMSWAAFVLSLLGVAAFAGLSVSKYTCPYAAAALSLCAFIAFLRFVSGQIIYLSDVFYGGVTASAISSLNGAFVACAVLFVIGIALGIVGIFTKQSKTEKSNETESE